MVYTVKINCSAYGYSPAYWLMQAGYYFYRKKAGNHSFVKHETNGRFEAHIIGSTIELHFDVWIGKDSHMVLPSDYTTQNEAKRIEQIIRGAIPATPRSNPRRRALRKRQNERRKEQSRKDKEAHQNTLTQKELSNIDWNTVHNPSFPQSTTCICRWNVIRWLCKRINTLLMNCKKNCK